MKDFLFTSESVTEGHPDKICDQISDAILDAYLEKDSYSRCAVECMATKNQLIIAGEISSNVKLDHEQIARDVIADIGYTNPDLGFHNGCNIMDLVHNQTSKLNANDGAGDQGIMFGYACNQTKELLPLPIVLAHKLTRRLTEVRKKNIIEGLHPDGKAQVTIEYKDNIPITVVSVVVSTHHDDRYKDDESFKFLQSEITKYVVMPIRPSDLINEQTNITVNPIGPWYECGGPAADTGLTGRKIIVDTYGGWARHGGGAFSGKDATKVDRSGAYMARYIAKDIVMSKLAEECEVQLGFVIGDQKPVSINLNTFGSRRISEEELISYVNNKYDLSVKSIIDALELRKPIYRKLSNYGHFGNNVICISHDSNIMRNRNENINEI
jgi:S-adenosylmethionine synthetase